MRPAAVRSVAVGFFDGVHLGHREILRSAEVALTFRNHPRSLLDPAAAPRLLMSPERRLAAIRSCGVGEVVALDFNRELAELDPVEFASRHLANRDGSLPAVYCGGDWRFGRRGAGDASLLRRLGYEVHEVEPVLFKGERISSSRIRTTIEKGDLAAANAMLGESFAVVGDVFRGKGVGRQIGYPTVNVALRDLKILLPYGVYAVETGGRRAIANYGLAPTFGDAAWKSPVMEINFRDGSEVSLSGEVEVRLLDFIRPERRFASPEDLARQIAEDVSRFAATGFHVSAGNERA